MKKDSGYNTAQKEKLLDFLINNKDKHTSAQEIDNYLRSVGSPVGMATIYRQLDRLEAEIATIKQRADELTAEFKRLSPEYTKLMERTEQINKEHRALLEQRWALEE